MKCIVCEREVKWFGGRGEPKLPCPKCAAQMLVHQTGDADKFFEAAQQTQEVKLVRVPTAVATIGVDNIGERSGARYHYSTPAKTDKGWFKWTYTEVLGYDDFGNIDPDSMEKRLLAGGVAVTIVRNRSGAF